MTEIDPGHLYSVDNYNTQNTIICQQIRFMKRIGALYPGNIGKPYSGTNSQELVRVLISRLDYVNNQKPFWTNPICTLLLRLILNMLEYRAALRHGRKFKFILKIENYPVIEKDGHLRYD